MVFAPTRDLSLVPAHEPAAAPRRREHIHIASDPARRLAWRAVVHAVDRDTVRTTWHLTGCAAPQAATGHCPEGQRLIETVGEPDGHCVINGRCPRCEVIAAAADPEPGESVC